VKPSQALLAPLVATTLTVLAAVAGLPALLLASRSPLPRRSAPRPVAGAPLQLVRSAQGTWFLNGQPIARDGLARLLQGLPGSSTELRFMPSSRLPVAEVSDSLHWLRRQSGGLVELELVSGRR
jgi:hypothetical protein